MIPSLRSRLQVALAATGLTLVCGAPAVADDTEIFVNLNSTQRARPNVLLIIDTSGSMEGEVRGGRAMYDPDHQYPGNCAADRVYWRQGPGEPPACSTARHLPHTSNRCLSAERSLPSVGLWTGVMAQWAQGANGDDGRWSRLDPANSDAPLECEADEGLHGPNASSPERWATDGGDGWSRDSRRKIDWSSREVYTLYSGNWLNWYHSAPASDVPVSRLDVVKSVATTLIGSVTNVNIGLMRFSNVRRGQHGELTAEGGMVIHPLADVTKSRQSLVNRISELTAAGGTPLSETLYEAAEYFAGRHVHYGLDSSTDGDTPFPSVPASRDPADPEHYRSPIEFQCQRNYIVLLTDGEPSQDNGADDRIRALPDFSGLVGGCDGNGQGRCLDDLAEYLYKGDLSDRPDRQYVQTYTIGFGPDVRGSTLLADTARSGGGEAFSADDFDGLSSALQRIFSDVLQSSSTFTTPSVSINALNRTQSRNDLYVSVFRPETSLRWPGNLKKYRIEGGRIVDVTGRDAIDERTGFFSRTAQDFWSPVQDGDRVEEGGAVSRLPDPADRAIFTQTGSNPDLTAAENAFDVGNASLSDELLGTSDDGPARHDVILWARGVDVKDHDADGNLDEPHRFMGDPLHARPAVVSYGDEDPASDAENIVVFVPTNDGFLHAVDARTGRELWAFIPRELLPRLRDLYEDPAVASRTYGLDGDVRVLRFDAERDGVIDPGSGDRVWIYFGMRRGGNHYYALDVTSISRPRVLWTLGPEELDGVGETWSTPALTRVRVGNGSEQNGEHIVLIFGGGYDAGQENYTFTNDTSGNRIFMVDAQTGKLLWFAGGPGGARRPNLLLDEMRQSIPAPVTVIDTDGDLYADRMYAADMGGRIWRFDIWNGNSPDMLVTGGVFADLGAAQENPPTIENTRRFYYAPDVALIQRRGADPYFSIAIGSGYRGHPLHTATRDRFYSLRDKEPFSRLPQGVYNNRRPITERDLVDITDSMPNAGVGTDARGWKLELRLNGWVGEKVLAEAVTANGIILFPTYQPALSDALEPCGPATGINRVYALQVDTGRPAVDFNHDQRITEEDAFTELSQTGIAGEVSFLFDAESDSTGGPGSGGPGGDDEDGTGVGRDALGRMALCLVGTEVLGQCVMPGGVVRTFWQRATVN